MVKLTLLALLDHAWDLLPSLLLIGLAMGMTPTLAVQY